jgi:hypothetical protein
LEHLERLGEFVGLVELWRRTFLADGFVVRFGFVVCFGVFFGFLTNT